MHPWQERLVEEKKDLDQKITKLQAFITGPNFGELDSENQYWIKEQLKAMENYYYRLQQRITFFK